MKIYRIPLYLAAACIIVFILQNLFLITDYLVLEKYAANGIWTLFTSIFLHADLMHVAYNMLALVIFGLILESIIGSRKFLYVFIISGLVASIAAALYYDASIGASGAIFGVMGCLAALRPRMHVWAMGVPVPMVVAAAVWLSIDIIGVLSPTNIANMAHIAGLFAGIVIGMFLRKKYAEHHEKSDKFLSEQELDEWERKWMCER